LDDKSTTKGADPTAAIKVSSILPPLPAYAFLNRVNSCEELGIL
jgi:hypothetical protein